VFTDSDPWSYRIFGSVAYGSIKSAHLSKHLATPEAEFVGIQPSDIVDYDLPTDPLSDSDVNALENELDDPRFDTSYWKKQIELQLDIDKKAEQQSLASRGLDFVTDSYLPERLGEMGYL
jgi:DNA topoisomerase-6 subunit A